MKIEIEDIQHISEILCAHFDGFDALVTANSIIYGGAIRDVLANLPLVGDLDIIVPENEFSRVCNNFLRSPRWLDTERSTTNNKVKNILYKSRYKNMPIKDTKTFKSVDDVFVQIISAKRKFGEDDNPILEVVKKTDIVCCGLIMESSGKIFEVVDGAVQDCRNRILRINKNNIGEVNLNKLKERIIKLESRGWKSEIDLADIEKQQKKLAKKKSKARKQENVVQESKHSRKINFHIRSETELIIELSDDSRKLLAKCLKIYPIKTRTIKSDVVSVTSSPTYINKLLEILNKSGDQEYSYDYIDRQGKNSKNQFLSGYDSYERQVLASMYTNVSPPTLKKAPNKSLLGELVESGTQKNFPKVNFTKKIQEEETEW